MNLLISTVVLLPRSSAGRRVAEVGRLSAAVGRWVRAYEGLSAEPGAPMDHRGRVEFVSFHRRINFLVRVQHAREGRRTRCLVVWMQNIAVLSSGSRSER